MAPRTVNTMPPQTFEAYRNHGWPEVRIHEAIATAPACLTALQRLEIDLRRITDELEEEGVRKFAASYDSLLAGIETRMLELSREAGAHR